MPALCSQCPPHLALSAALEHPSALLASARDTLAMFVSWPQSSYQMALTCSARLHHLPQTQVGWHNIPGILDFKVRSPHCPYREWFKKASVTLNENMAQEHNTGNKTRNDVRAGNKSGSVVRSRK